MLTVDGHDGCRHNRQVGSILAQVIAQIRNVTGQYLRQLWVLLYESGFDTQLNAELMTSPSSQPPSSSDEAAVEYSLWVCPFFHG